MYGVVGSVVPRLFEDIAVDCVGRCAVFVGLRFNQFTEASVEVSKVVFGIIFCVWVLCVGPCS